MRWPVGATRDWFRNHNVAVALGAALILSVLGILTGRGTLIALATPLLLTGLWSLNERPRAHSEIASEPLVRTGAHSRDLKMAVRAASTLALPAAALRMRVSFPGVPTRDILVSIEEVSPLEFSIQSVRTGLRELFTLKVITHSFTLGWFSTETQLPTAHLLVLPRIEPVPGLPTSPTVRGLTGPRPSRRLGDGYEFRDVAQMTSGDRARQIDWRVTARQSVMLDQLYVRRNYAQAESTTMILVDSRDDVGTEVALWGSAHEARPDQMTSLDIARSAGASLAKAALDAGDRVGVEDLGRPRSPVLPGTGARQFDRVTHTLALAKSHGAPQVRSRAPFVPAGALVYVLSTFLDETAFVTIASLVRSGHTVVAIDTLPQTSLWAMSQRQLLAWRLVNLDRSAQISLTKNLGVKIVRWANPDRYQQLAVLVRTASAGHRPGRTRRA